MITFQDAFLIIFGLLFCFTGYSMFRDMLPLWGFILGGWITYLFLPLILGAERAGQLLIQVIAIGAGGLIGALIAVPLYYVIVFLSGAVLGMLFGVMLGALINIGGITSIRQITTFTAMAFPPSPQTGLQYLLMGIGGLIMGGLAINFQKFMICASSAFLGSAALITGVAGPITNISPNDMSRGAIMITVWLILAMAGLFIQFRMLGEV